MRNFMKILYLCSVKSLNTRCRICIQQILCVIKRFFFNSFFFLYGNLTFLRVSKNTIKKQFSLWYFNDNDEKFTLKLKCWKWFYFFTLRFVWVKLYISFPPFYLFIYLPFQNHQVEDSTVYISIINNIFEPWTK